MSTSRTERRAGAITRAVFPTVIAATGDEPSIVINTGAIDRMGDIVDPAGGVLDAYRKNPVVLFAHNHDELPVGSTTSISVELNGLRASWKWLENDERAARVRNAFEQGVLRAASIGFVPIEFDNIDGGLRFTKWELIEWSLCPVPANAEAVRTLKALGLEAAQPDSESRPIDASAVQRASRALRRLEKTGRAVSSSNAADIYKAIALLEGVLQQVNPNDDDKQIMVDGVPIEDLDDVFAGFSDEEARQLVREAIEKTVAEQVMLATGRVD